MMYCIFNASDQSLVLVTSVVNSNFQTEDYLIGTVEDSDYEKGYNWTYNDEDIDLESGNLIDRYGKAVKGSAIVIEQSVIDQMETERQATQYQLDRKHEYPDIREQFDKLYHDIANGTLDQTGEFFTSIKAVKDSHPKPE